MQPKALIGKYDECCAPLVITHKVGKLTEHFWLLDSKGIQFWLHVPCLIDNGEPESLQGNRYRFVLVEG